MSLAGGWRFLRSLLADLLALVALPGVLLLSFVHWSLVLMTVQMPVHNLSLWRFGRSFAALEHPPGTRRLQAVREVGNFSPTGNQCIYFVAERRSYPGTRESVRSFYRGATVRNPVTGGRQPVKLVFFERGGFCPDDALPTGFREPRAWDLGPDRAEPPSYVVFIDYCDSEGLLLDYRCN